VSPLLPIPVSPLTAAAYAPFGEVVEPRAAGRIVNRGEALRHDRLAALSNRRADATANLGLFEVRQRQPPLRVDWLERHLFSTQAFLPVSAGRYVVTVAAGHSEPDAGQAGAFLACGGTGITYRPGIWHHGLIPVDGPMRFAMLVWEDGSAADCEIIDLNRPLELTGAGLV
jgi:ureidoglycolate lyase